MFFHSFIFISFTIPSANQSQLTFHHSDCGFLALDYYVLAIIMRFHYQSVTFNLLEARFYLQCALVPKQCLFAIQKQSNLSFFI